ncbi:hypothetical protein TraAM80_04491 [Trypanosoma rangeli]|uniref:Uncharacterized protein n=1 Tax=Trypanosoma rangeli TaxID=5698 RepID=A0A422NJI7_TRYRA|nr:uncharacterized protein TraAM80_04491 [Trypanosoma rangeli]RNF05658.1 hypothetical protein TraAM80_04491 [Trypanosoma rangeli]|eukprot:RNF05658.1 hypothetical protein TraAM80_04491 [Trypanosoma rangeli]
MDVFLGAECFPPCLVFYCAHPAAVGGWPGDVLVHTVAASAPLLPSPRRRLRLHASVCVLQRCAALQLRVFSFVLALTLPFLPAVAKCGGGSEVRYGCLAPAACFWALPTQLLKRGVSVSGLHCCRGVAAVLQATHLQRRGPGGYVRCGGPVCGGHQVQCAAHIGGEVIASGFCRVRYVRRRGLSRRWWLLLSRPHRGVLGCFCCARVSTMCGCGLFLVVVRRRCPLLAVGGWCVAGGAYRRLHRLPVCSSVPTARVCAAAVHGNCLRLRLAAALVRFLHDH